MLELHIRVCHAWAGLGARKGQTRVLDALEQDLWMVVSYPRGHWELNSGSLQGALIPWAICPAPPCSLWSGNVVALSESVLLGIEHFPFWEFQIVILTDKWTLLDISVSALTKETFLQKFWSESWCWECREFLVTWAMQKQRSYQSRHGAAVWVMWENCELSPTANIIKC